MSAASLAAPILVADDNPDQRALYVDILTHAGYSRDRGARRRGGDRAGAARTARAHPHGRHDAGNEWLERRPCACASRSETRDIPVIVITGLAGTRDRDASFAAGSDAYLSKPVSPRRLLEEVRRFLPR